MFNMLTAKHYDEENKLSAKFNHTQHTANVTALNTTNATTLT